MSESEKVLKFPFKNPLRDNRFPFKNKKFYTMSPADDSAQDKERTRRTMGYTAQCSLRHLEATGRKPDLTHVPWFRSVWRRR